MVDRRKLNLDRERVSVLLSINVHLIKKACSIYVGVLNNQQTFRLMLPQNRQSVVELFNNLNRRLQYNLSVLLYISDLYHNKAGSQQSSQFQFPVILSTPPEMPELHQLYKRLQELYPEAIQFLKSKMQDMKQQQDPGTMSTPSPMSKSEQLQQQMPMLGNAAPKPGPYLQLQNSSYGYDMGKMNSPSFDSAMNALQSRGVGTQPRCA